METKDTKTKKLLLVIILAAVIAVAAVVGVMYAQSRATEKNYAVSLENAEKYLAENDYENAILEYQKAIEINPEEEQAYLDLAQVYLDQGEKSEAITILERGYLKTKSSAISAMRDSISLIDEIVSDGDSDDLKAVDVDLTTASDGLTWNTSFLQKLAGYTYKDFRSDFGAVTVKNQDLDGYVVVRHSGLDADFYYRNTTENKNIVNETKGMPNDDAMPEKAVFDDISSLFRNFDGCASISRIEEMLGSSATIRSGNDGPYIEYTIAGCDLCIGTDSDGNITSGDGWNEVLFPNANEGTQSGSLSGVVVDAVTGQGVSGATVTCTANGSSKSVTTDSNGAFTAQLDAGNYTITIEANGYISEDFEITIKEGEKKTGEQFTISPELSGEARIVLEWNATPTDLDSYLEGTTDSGASVSTSYYNKISSSGGTVLADLDLDDRNGYGPETTTIHELNGVYTFTVVDFTGSGTMAAQGATVKVYLPGQSVQTITLSSGSGVTNTWVVCKIDHGTLQVLNQAGD